jgi:hypothetical protein
LEEWKVFEQAVLTYQKQYFPGSTITHDKKLSGRNSQTERQIDIWIENEIGNIQINIAIECKNYKKNIDIKKIEEIIGLFEDVGAHKGVVFTSKGYSKAAVTLAKNKGLDLFTIKHRDLHSFTDNIGKIQCVADLRMIKSCNLKAQSRIPTQQISSGTYDITKVNLYDLHGKLIGTPVDIFERKWNSGHLSMELGFYEDIEFLE